MKPGLIILVSVFLGCETEDDVGVSFPLDTDLEAKFIEFDLPSTNVYIDSLRTDRENFVSVGNYTDQLTGSVSAEGYFSLSYVAGTIPDNIIETNFEFDSVRLSMAFTSSIAASGAFNQSIVYGHLTDTLNSAFTYLSSNKKDTIEQIGRTSFDVIPNDTTISNILLSESFGQSIFSAAKSSSSVSQANWPSLSVASENDNQGMSNALLNNNDSRLYIYVRHPDGKEVIIGEDTTFRDTVYQAEFILAGTKYTHLIRNRNSSQFEGIVENSDFDIADGRTVIDPLMGISTAFSIEALDQFFNDNDEMVFNGASIFLEIEDALGRDTLETFASYFRKPDKSFFGPAINSGQAIFSSTITTDETYLGQELSPAFSSLDQNLAIGSNASLTISCTNFFNFLYDEYQDSGVLQFDSQSLENPKPLTEFVLINQLGFNFNRTVFKKDGIKLRIYYTEIESN